MRIEKGAKRGTVPARAIVPGECFWSEPGDTLWIAGQFAELEGVKHRRCLAPETGELREIRLDARVIPEVSILLVGSDPR